MMRRTVAAILTLAGCGLGLWGFQASQSRQEQKPVPSYYKSAEAAKPYPKTMPPERYPKQSQQEAYRLAREIPGVLAQQPCYCYCDRSGHGSLLHCHRDDHSAG
jgi:hypothetical protein